MTFKIRTTSRFERKVRRFRRNHPELAPKIDDVLRDLATDPFQPHLRLHPLRGDLSGSHAVSLTYSYRIVLTLVITDREITLLDIGTHDEVYR